MTRRRCAANPALDFARCQIAFARSVKVLNAADGTGADHPLHGGTLRIIVPVAAAPVDAAAAKRRAATIRAVRALTTSNDARFLAGELWQLRALPIEEAARVR